MHFRGGDQKKTGSQANGDSCSMFQLDDGMYHVCVSDGMGSGKQAQAESTLVVDLLESFWRPALAGKVP